MGWRLLVALACTVAVCACGSRGEAPTFTPDFPEVTLRVRGELDTTIQEGWAAVDYSASTTGASGTAFTITLRPRRAPNPIVVFSGLPLGVAPGRYSLGSSDTTAQIVAHLAWVDDAEDHVFARNVRGTLAIADTNGGLAGRYRFAASRGWPDTTAAEPAPFDTDTTSTTSSASPDDTSRVSTSEVLVEGSFRHVRHLRRPDPGPVTPPGAASEEDTPEARDADNE